MNRVNPIHILALLVVLLVFFIFKVSEVKSELAVAQNEYKQRVKVSQELKDLEKAYGSKKDVENIIRRFKVNKDFKNSSVVLSSSSMDKNEIDKLMGRLLNSPCNIASFDIKKISDDKVSFDMEIKW